MNSEYILRINTDEEKYNTLTTMLGVKPTSTKAYWELSINERSGQYRDAINYFLELIENHIEKLNKIGIKKEDLSLWYLYEYEGQCNMEFHPDQLKKLGDCGITFCISCWEKYR